MYHTFIFKLEEKHDYFYIIEIFEKWGGNALKEHILSGG